jgi:tetratricopeptide (TPR) repeat protein
MALFAPVLVLALYAYVGDPTNLPKILLYHWFAALAMTFFLVATWWKRETLEAPPVFFVPLLALLALYLISASFSPIPPHSLVYVRQFAMLTGVYFVVSHSYRSPEQMARWMLVFCSAVFVSSLYGFAQRLGYDFFPWGETNLEEYHNIPATFGNPNFAAHCLVLSVIFAVYLATTDRRRWYCWGFVAVYLAHLYFTKTRGSMVALAAALLLVVLAKALAQSGGSPLRKTVTTIMLAAGTVFAAAAAGALGLFLATGSVLPTDTALLLRYNSYFGAARMILDHPVLGFGPGIYEYANIQFWTPFEQWWFSVHEQLNEHVHNGLLETAVDAGVLAAAFYLALLVLGIVHGLYLYFLRQDPARRRFGLATAAFFTAFLVDGLFGFNLRVPVSAFLLFVMMGFVEAFYLEARPVQTFLNRFGRPMFLRLAVVLVAVLSVQMVTRSFNAERYLQSGRGAMTKEGDHFAAAATLFHRGAGYAPWDYRYPLNEALAQVKLKQYARAVELAQEAADLRPDYIVTLVVAADAKRDLAVKEYATSPERGLELLEEARQSALRVTELCPQYALAQELLGRMAATEALLVTQTATEDAKNALWQEAETHLQQAVAFGGDEPGRLFMMLARAQLTQGKYPETLRSLQQSVHLEPGNRDAWSVFSEYAEKARGYEEMNEALGEQIAKLEASTEDTETLALLYLWQAYVLGTKLDRPQEALDAYTATLNALPERAEIWADFALFASLNGFEAEFRNAVQTQYERARATASTLPATVEAVATAWADGPTALYRGAEILVTAVTSGQFDTPDVPMETLTGWAGRVLLDEIQGHAGKPADVAEAAYMLSRYFLAVEALPAAEQLLRLATPHLPAMEQADAAQQLAILLEKQDRQQEAIPVLQQAVRSAPMHTGVRLKLAETLEAVGRTAEARLEYTMLTQSPALPAEWRSKVEAALKRLEQ